MAKSANDEELRNADAEAAGEEFVPDELLPGGQLPTGGNAAIALEIAELPREIRGFGHVKARALEAAAARRDALLAQWRAQP